MRINDYSTLKLSDATVIHHAHKVNQKLIEKILLSLIAILGFMGSMYVFSASSNGNGAPQYNNMAVIAAASTYDATTDDKKEKFKNFFKIEGDKEAGEMLNFIFKEDRNSMRYVLDMGNGERVIITSDEFPYKFDKAGTYLLELKTISRGLITTIATKELKIK